MVQPTTVELIRIVLLDRLEAAFLWVFLIAANVAQYLV